MIDEMTSKEARLEMYRQQVDALEQRVRDLEANLFAATATVASLEARMADVEQSHDRLREALRRIANYDQGSGCCAYGCDTPSIAIQVLREG